MPHLGPRQTADLPRQQILDTSIPCGRISCLVIITYCFLLIAVVLNNSLGSDASSNKASWSMSSWKVNQELQIHERQTRVETQCTVPHDPNNRTRECLMMTTRFNPQSNKVYRDKEKSGVDSGSQSRIRKVQDWTKCSSCED